MGSTSCAIKWRVSAVIAPIWSGGLAIVGETAASLRCCQPQVEAPHTLCGGGLRAAAQWLLQRGYLLHLGCGEIINPADQGKLFMDAMHIVVECLLLQLSAATRQALCAEL